MQSAAGPKSAGAAQIPARLSHKAASMAAAAKAAAALMAPEEQRKVSVPSRGLATGAPARLG